MWPYSNGTAMFTDFPVGTRVELDHGTHGMVERGTVAAQLDSKEPGDFSPGPGKPRLSIELDYQVAGNYESSRSCTVYMSGVAFLADGTAYVLKDLRPASPPE